MVRVRMAGAGAANFEIVKFCDSLHVDQILIDSRNDASAQEKVRAFEGGGGRGAISDGARAGEGMAVNYEQAGVAAAAGVTNATRIPTPVGLERDAISSDPVGGA